MEINKHGLSLVGYLYDNNGCSTLQQAQKFLGLSKRSLLYQIDKMNDFFTEHGLSVIECTNKHVKIHMEEQEKAEGLLFSDQMKKWYLLSAEERLAFISIVISVGNVSVTTESLCSKMDISKNTLVTDIVALKKKLRNVGLKLESNNKTGYKLSGEEATIRFYTMECLQVFYGNPYSKHYILLIYKELFLKRNFQTSYDELHERIRKRLEDFAEQNYQFTKDSMEEIFLHITFIFLRERVPSILIYQDDISSKQEFDLATDMMDELERAGFNCSNKIANRNYLTEILLSSKRHNDLSQKSMEQDLVQFTEKLIQNFEKLAFIKLENKKEFLKKLLLHIRPMYYRLKYHIRIHNVLNEEIQEKYTMFFNLTKKALELTGQNYFTEIPDDEIAYICVYFAGWVNQNVSEMEQDGAAHTILLVVSGGNSTSSLIQLQLVNLLKPMRFHYEVIASHQFDVSMIHQYALIVGDIPSQYNQFNIIPVSAILTESQRNRILQWSIQFSNMNNDDGLTRLFEIIKMHCTIHDEEILKAKLFSYLNENNSEATMQIPSLLQIFKPEHVYLFREPVSMDELMVVATKDFIQNKIVKLLYPINVMHILNTMGPYGEISRGVLLLHAEDTSYCNKLGIHICNLKYPIQFKNNGHKMHTIILLSTPDKVCHLKILENLSQLFRNADFLEKLEKFSFESKEELYKNIAQLML